MKLKVQSTIIKTCRNIIELNCDDIETIITNYIKIRFPDDTIEINWNDGQLPSITVITTNESTEDNSL